MKRVIAYIDGYNLYYGLLKGTPYKWLDLVSFVKRFLRPDQEIVGIKYLTAPIKTYPHDGGAVDRQKVYLQALSAMSLITIVQGFYAKNKTLVADIFSRLDFAERRGSGLGKIMDAYSLPLSNADGRLPTFTSDTFFRAILPNMTYGLPKESLVAFAERGATPNSRTPDSRNRKSAIQVDRTSRPNKSTEQVSHTSHAFNVATAESRVRLVLSLLANGELSLRELMHAVGLRNRPNFYSLYILPSFEMGCVEYTVPDRPKSRLQKYRLTDKGRAALSASEHK